MNTENTKQWFVMRDLKRANSLSPAYKMLGESGLEAFTPLCEKVVVRGSTKKKVKVPVITDLLFVNSTKAELDPIVSRTPTLQYRFLKGKPQFTPMTVTDAEMQRFIAACDSGQSIRYYSPEEITADKIGSTIKVIGGTLDGMSGRLLKMRGSKKRRLIIELPGILAVSVEVSPEFIEYV